MASYRGANVWKTLGQGVRGIGRTVQAQRDAEALEARRLEAERVAQEERDLRMATARFNMDEALRERGGELGSVTGLLSEPRYGASPNAGMPEDIRAALAQSEGPSLFERQSLLTLPEPGALPEINATTGDPFARERPNPLAEVRSVVSGGRTYRGLDTPVGEGYVEDPTTRAQRLAQEKAAQEAAAELARRNQMRTDMLAIPGTDPARVEAKVRGVDFDDLIAPPTEVKTERVNEGGRWVVYKINPDGTRTRMQEMGAAGNPRATPATPRMAPADAESAAWEILDQFRLAPDAQGRPQYDWDTALATATDPQVRTAINAIRNPLRRWDSGATGAATVDALDPITAEIIAEDPEMAAALGVAPPVVRRPSPVTPGAGRTGGGPSAATPAMSDVQVATLKQRLGSLPRAQAEAVMREAGASQADILRVLGPRP